MQAVHLCQVWSTSTDRCLKAPNVDVLSILFYAERQCLITSCGNGLNSKMVLLIVPMYIFSWSSAPVRPLIFEKKGAPGGCSGFFVCMIAYSGHDSRGCINRMLVAQSEHHRQESVDWIQAYMRHEFTAAPLV